MSDTGSTHHGDKVAPWGWSPMHDPQDDYPATPGEYAAVDDCSECHGAIPYPHHHRDTLDGPEVVRGGHVDGLTHGYEDEPSTWDEHTFVRHPDDGHCVVCGWVEEHPFHRGKPE